MRLSRLLHMSPVLLAALTADFVRAADSAGETADNLIAAPGRSLEPSREIPNWDKDWSYENPDGTYAKRQGSFIRIGNKALERVYRVVEDSIGTIQLVNKITGRDPGSQQ